MAAADQSVSPDNNLSAIQPSQDSTVYVFYAPYIEFGFSPTVVLQQLTLQNMAHFYGALGGVAAIACVFQLLAAIKKRLYSRYLRNQRLRAASGIDDDDSDENCDGCSCLLFMSLTSLHIIQTMCGFILVLVAASFNGWLIIAMVGGSALGYLMRLWRCCCDQGHTDLKIP